MGPARPAWRSLDRFQHLVSAGKNRAEIDTAGSVAGYLMVDPAVLTRHPPEAKPYANGPISEVLSDTLASAPSRTSPTRLRFLPPMCRVPADSRHTPPNFISSEPNNGASPGKSPWATPVSRIAGSESGSTVRARSHERYRRRRARRKIVQSILFRARKLSLCNRGRAGHTRACTDRAERVTPGPRVLPLALQ